ncbi:MAG: CcmD family protein [Bacteroidota bacterium]|nr:CcmD family protein [Bacteroidota bacterium]
MYEFLAEHSEYVVLAVALIVWAGVFAYLVRIDRRVRKLERKP